MPPDKHAVVQKVAKLFRLAQGTTHAEEAQAAIAAAQRLLAEHRLSLADLGEAAAPGERPVHARASGLVPLDGWESYLATTLAANFRCAATIVCSPGERARGRIVFIGLDTDAAVCRATYRAAVAIIARQVRAYLDARWPAASRAPERARARREWIDGFLYGVARRLAEQKMSAGSRFALALVVPEVVRQETIRASRGQTAVQARVFTQRQTSALEEGFREGYRFDGAARLEGK